MQSLRGHAGRPQCLHRKQSAVRHDTKRAESGTKLADQLR